MDRAGRELGPPIWQTETLTTVLFPRPLLAGKLKQSLQFCKSIDYTGNLIINTSKHLQSISTPCPFGCGRHCLNMAVNVYRMCITLNIISVILWWHLLAVDTMLPNWNGISQALDMTHVLVAFYSQQCVNWPLCFEVIHILRHNPQGCAEDPLKVTSCNKEEEEGFMNVWRNVFSETTTIQIQSPITDHAKIVR